MSSDQINLYLVTFNAARAALSSSFSQHFLDGLKYPNLASRYAGNHGISSTPDVIALSILEVAPLSNSFIGGTWLDDPYFNSFVNAVHEVTRNVLMEEYALIAKNNVGMAAIMVFVRSALTDQVTKVGYGGVGVGLWGMGNKAGVGLRIYYGVRSEDEPIILTFVAMHLAPHEWNAEARNKDWERIVRRMVFEGLDGQIIDENYSGVYSPKAHVFVMGDLNYRTSSTRPIYPDQLLFPQPHDKKANPSYVDNLWKRDQLNRELKRGHVLHGFKEPIKRLDQAPFPPTYKFKVANDHLETAAYDPNHWDWEKRRWPSWTDRIFMLAGPEEEGFSSNSGISIHNYDWIPHITSSDHKPVALCVSIPALPLPPLAPIGASQHKDFRTEPPFPIDVDWKERRTAARMREIAVGIAAFLTSTPTGAVITLGTVSIALGSWWFLQSEWLNA